MIVNGICVYEKDKGTAEVASTQQVITVQKDLIEQGATACLLNLSRAASSACNHFQFLQRCLPVWQQALAGSCRDPAQSFSPALAVLEGVSVGVSGMLLPPFCLLYCCSVSSAEPWCLCWSCKPLSSLLFYKPQWFSLLPLSLGTFLWDFLLF